MAQGGVMTARAVHVRDGWLRWAVHCPDHQPPFFRRVQGSEQTARHVAELHNQHHHPTPESAK